jgi:dephospho-CoA kinase
MKVFGLTGGIGMGKTTAGDLLNEHGVPVIDTDVLAREIVEPGRPALHEIQLAFGNEVIGPGGRLRRDELARIVFSDPAARQQLENITHPRIRELWQAQIEHWRQQKSPSVAVIIPLLFETGAERALNATICVACSAATQRRRLLERGWTAEQVEDRLAAQWPADKKMARADYVAWNEASLEVLQEQLDRIIPAGRP